MKHDLFIREHNVQAHLDIESDVRKQSNGVFNFTLRINGGNIVDYNVVEYVNASKYRSVKSITGE